MSYQTQRYLAIATAVLLAGMAVIQAADPADFGLSPVMARWLGVAGAMLGVLATFLPSVRGMGNDPEFLIHRISELPQYQQQVIASTLADRAEHEAGTAHEADDDPAPWLPPERKA